MLCKLSVVCVLCNLCCVLCIFTPVVDIAQGKVRGLRDVVTGHYNYFGIPYAVAGRFQTPQPPPKWVGTLNAVNRFSTCPQAVSYFIIGREDCLHLDIYTPGPRAPRALPVMVFLHGGAYYHGAKYHYDPEFLVSHNVIVIIINYRLGVLGFLCLNGTSNLGLKDQLASLRWVQKNIKYFGGDPDNVTLFGQSAGASAAALLLLTEASKGLVHKAILQSGSPIAPWAFNLDPVTPAIQDATKLGAKSSDISEVYQTFANASLFDLLVATKDTSINSKYFKYAPCIEDKSLFSDTPYDILRSGNYNRVPLIVGFTDVEGLLFYGLHSDETLEDLDENFHDKLPSVFSWCSRDERRNISAKLRDHYFGSRRIDRLAVKQIIEYYSDWLTYSTSFAFTDTVVSASAAPVYSYIFSYEGERNLAKFIFGSGSRWSGATHSDDIFYIFKPGGLRLILTTLDKIIINRMATMWTNFAKTGNPTPSTSRLLPTRWVPVTNTTKQLLRIDRNTKMVPKPNKLGGSFFLDLLCEHGQTGFVPCVSSENCNKS